MAYTGPKLSQLHGPALQQRLKVLASNPATRSAVPTRYLTGGLAKYAQQRNLNARLDTPVVPGSTLTGRGLAQEANAAVQTQYGPQDQALQQQLLSNQNQPLVTGGYFDTYINTLRQAAQAQQAAAAQNQAALSSMAQTGQQAAQTANQGVLGGLQADAAKRGATVDPKLAATFQAGTNVNAGLANAQAGTAGLLGQAEQNYLSGLTAGAGAGRAQALNAIGGKRADLLAQQTQLKATEGAANEAYRSKRVSQEATNVAMQTVANMNASTKQAQVQTGQYNAQTQRQSVKSRANQQNQSVADRRATFAATHGGYSPQDFAKLPSSQQLSILKQTAAATRAPARPKGPGKGTQPVAGLGSLTRAEETKRATQIKQIADLLQNPPKLKTGGTASRDQIIAEIKSGTSPLGKGVDPGIINAGQSIAANQGTGIGEWGAKQAEKAGVHVNGRWKIVKPKGASSLDVISQGVQGATGQ